MAYLKQEKIHTIYCGNALPTGKEKKINCNYE
jgi:hypothetical protein